MPRTGGNPGGSLIPVAAGWATVEAGLAAAGLVAGLAGVWALAAIVPAANIKIRTVSFIANSSSKVS
jgi:hypothetical protein